MSMSRDGTRPLAGQMGDGCYDLKPTPTDTERLDWIEANRACFGHYKETGRWWSRAGRSFATAREAIDAAMLHKHSSPIRL